eukprot:scaffold52888_cov70-Phaeocystis_antarctica.AAC.13
MTLIERHASVVFCTLPYMAGRMPLHSPARAGAPPSAAERYSITGGTIAGKRRPSTSANSVTVVEASSPVSSSRAGRKPERSSSFS